MANELEQEIRDRGTSIREDAAKSLSDAIGSRQQQQQQKKK
jgi:hypothetical protein